MSTPDVGELWLQRAADYAVDVRSGKIPACKYVKLAVKRWFNDLKHGHKRGLCFDEEAAKRYFRFIARYCRHSEGEWAGKLIVYEPWQCFIEANIHGWKKADGTRRFTIVYEEVARKNGKTLRMGANGLFYLEADNEPGAQVYSAATKREQAREIFDASLEMVRQSAALSRRLRAEEHKIRPVGRRGRYTALSKDSKKMDGFNVHAGLIDELHAHPSSGVYNVLRSGMSARRQGIIRQITTAGFDRKSFCYSQRQYAIKILEGTVENDSWFAIIYTIDNRKKWDQESEWIKANPNLGISVSLDTLRQQCKEAKDIPDQKVEFLTKKLNIWTYGVVAWMNMEKWQCTRDPKLNGVAPFAEITEANELFGQECYGGLDLASVEDMCSLAICFEEDDKRKVFQRSWLPQAALERRLNEGDPTLEKYVEQGHLVVLPGDVVDYDFIEADILRICERFNVKSIAFDRFNSSQLVNNLMSQSIPMVQFGQGFGSMSAPTKEFMRLAYKGLLTHNDPLLTWAVSNVVVAKNPAGDIKPDKSKVSEKIDPAVAAIMAIAMAMKLEEQPDDSIYNKTEL